MSRRAASGWRGALAVASLAVVTLAVAACGGDPSGTTGPTAGARLQLTVSGLVALDAVTQGRYEAWSLDASGGATSLGTLAVSGTQAATLDVAFPSSTPSSILVTVQAPGDAATTPSVHRLLTDDFRNDRATLEVDDALTLGGLALKQLPGQFTMFSPSDNYKNGYPSFEECGVWLFNMAPRLTPQNDMWVRLTPLTSGWTYEGWMVRDYGAADAIWLSYGKFVPDASGAVTTRDDTGWGAYSGVMDFKTAGEEEFPGDDWFANPLGFPLPSSLHLPLDLREKTSSGASRWTHVLTIEPMSDKGEAIGSERPFAVRPYRDAFGDGAPGIARTITFRPDGVPRGEAVRR